MKSLVNQCKSKLGITTISQDQIIYMKTSLFSPKRRSKGDHATNQTNNLQLKNERETEHQSHQKNRTHNQMHKQDNYTEKLQLQETHIL